MRKHLRYLHYVLLHKWYVFQECLRLDVGLRGLVHDLSKFLPDEWGPYANKFYGGPYGHFDQRNVDAGFDKAWLRHIHRNPHHWQHWVLREDSGAVKCLDMPYDCVLEMIADWWGAGRAIHGAPEIEGPGEHYKELREWYLANRDKMQMSERTRTRTEHFVGIPMEQRMHLRPEDGWM